MSYLFDTHLLIWALREPRKLTKDVAALLSEPAIDRCFSVIAIWECAIKNAQPGTKLDLHPTLMRTTLIRDGFRELAITSAHALAVRELPLLHRDPFDRMLVAQAQTEGLTLVTADATLARYPVAVRKN